jgi:FAD/FMN-containing dehydrogenase
MAQRPLGLEGFDARLTEMLRKKDLYVDHLQYLPEGAGWLLVEFGGDTAEEAESRARAALEAIRNADSPIQDARVYVDARAQRAVWAVRESALAATAFVPASR